MQLTGSKGGQSTRKLRRSIHVVTSALMCILLSLQALCAENVASPSSFTAPVQLWKFSSEAYIYVAKPTSEGGAFVATSRLEPDGGTKPGGNAIYRVKSDGTVPWKYSGSEEWRVSFQDATPDAKLVLAALIPTADPEHMRLVVLEDTGKVLRQTGMLNDSNWVWLSQDGQFILRWDRGVRTLILEELASGKQLWTLEDIQPPVSPINVDFVEPVLGGGYVLLGDKARGVAVEVDTRGRHSWQIKGLADRLPGPASPFVITPSGTWLAAIRVGADCTSSIGTEAVSIDTPPPDLSHVDDTVALIRVPKNEGNDGSRTAHVVWERATRTNLLMFQRIRKGLAGGAVLGIDLLERQSEDGPLPRLAILTNAGVTTLDFDARGWVQSEVLWNLPDVPGVSQVWLLPSGHLLVKRRATKEAGQALHIIDRTGTILWELKPDKEILSVSFDPQRRYMLVGFLREVQAFRLD